ncbi:CHASE2 domain-containing protein [Brevundimonas sp.]|uniref:CHASE2 domain-containing protein n=1 Tax=Brevundimonas sp. TaxID=1871086 RepID=UPI0025BC3BFA|nr:CHASE2 domain-containing protein [Brevundimonas sp.]
MTRRGPWGDPRRAGRRALLEWIAVTCLVVTATVALSSTWALSRANGLAYDSWMRWGAGAPSEEVLVVAIDNRSLGEVGRWPWSRGVHADLIDRLSNAGARAIAMDILFFEPEGDADALLAEALQASGRVCLAEAVDPQAWAGGRPHATGPIAPLGSSAAGQGHVNLTADEDGIVRRLPLWLTGGGQAWPHLAACLLDVAGHPLPSAPSSSADRLAADPLMVRFRGPPGAFRTVSASDVLRGETPRSAIDNRLVIVGVTADGLGDRYATPTSVGGRLFNGVEIQAALVDTLVSDAGVRPVSSVATAVVSAALILLLMGGLLIFNPRWSLALSLGLVIAVLMASWSLLQLGWWFEPAAAVLGAALALPLWSWRRLVAASVYLETELIALDRDAPGPFLWRRIGSDVVARQASAMTLAIDGLKRLNRFISGVLQDLPDATLVVDADGMVRLANVRAEDLFERRPLTGEPFQRLLTELGAPATEGEFSTPQGRILSVSITEVASGDGLRIVRLADVTAARVVQRQREAALQLLGHDMRAPLTSILAVLEGGGRINSAHLRQRIGDNARLTLRMADSYVQLARAESQPLEPEIFDAADLLIDAADSLWPLAHARSVALVTPPQADGVMVLADRVLLTRALINLIDNAIKVAPRGTRIDVRLDADTEAGAVRLEVEDEGPGLEPAEFEDLCRPFQRREGPGPGVGLGLAFVRATVERHGGRLVCGKGARGGALVRISLPAASPDP